MSLPGLDTPCGSETQTDSSTQTPSSRCPSLGLLPGDELGCDSAQSPCRATRGMSTSSVSNQCIICMDRKREVVLYPCTHALLCHHCAMLLQSPTCPVCRTNIDRMRPIFPRHSSAPSVTDAFDLDGVLSAIRQADSSEDNAGRAIHRSATLDDDQMRRLRDIPAHSPAPTAQPPIKVLLVGTSVGTASAVSDYMRSLHKIPDSHPANDRTTGNNRANIIIEGVPVRLKAAELPDDDLEQEFLDMLRARKPDLLVLCASEKSLPSFETLVRWDLSICDSGLRIQTLWLISGNAKRRNAPRAPGTVTVAEVESAMHFVSSRRQYVFCARDSLFKQGLRELASAILTSRGDAIPESRSGAIAAVFTSQNSGTAARSAASTSSQQERFAGRLVRRRSRQRQRAPLGKLSEWTKRFSTACKDFFAGAAAHSARPVSGSELIPFRAETETTPTDHYETEREEEDSEFHDARTFAPWHRACGHRSETHSGPRPLRLHNSSYLDGSPGEGLTAGAPSFLEKVYSRATTAARWLSGAL